MEYTKLQALIKKLRASSPFIESNIFKSVENVNLDTIIAYKQNGVKHHFLDEYENKKNTKQESNEDETETSIH